MRAKLARFFKVIYDMITVAQLYNEDNYMVLFI